VTSPTLPVLTTDVLILGGGFAGAGCARRLERLLPKDARITLVSSESQHPPEPRALRAHQHPIANARYSNSDHVRRLRSPRRRSPPCGTRSRSSGCCPSKYAAATFST
jgi:siroheme synthase (precorrin-2 oxidase/ferrochelatase)